MIKAITESNLNAITKNRTVCTDSRSHILCRCLHVAVPASSCFVHRCRAACTAAELQMCCVVTHSKCVVSHLQVPIGTATVHHNTAANSCSCKLLHSYMTPRIQCQSSAKGQEVGTGCATIGGPQQKGPCKMHRRQSTKEGSHVGDAEHAVQKREALPAAPYLGQQALLKPSTGPCPDLAADFQQKLTLRRQLAPACKGVAPLQQCFGADQQ